jgi:hypothetical protein
MKWTKIASMWKMTTKKKMLAMMTYWMMRPPRVKL